MHPAALAFAALLIALGLGFASAQEGTQFRSQEEGFSIVFPAAPTVTREESAKVAGLVSTKFQVVLGDTTYRVDVVQMPSRYWPKDLHAHFLEVVKGYARGANTALRSTTDVQIDGRPGVEAVVEKGGLEHLLDVTALEQRSRIYLIVLVGRESLASSPAARRFRDSFSFVPQ